MMLWPSTLFWRIHRSLPDDALAPRVQELDASDYFQDDEHADLTAVVFPTEDLTVAPAAH